MISVKFPYQQDKSSLFGEVYRPVVEFEVKVNSDWIPIIAILDSGADISLLPKSFLDAFGFEPKKEEVKEVRGIGEGRIPIVIKTIRIKFVDKEFDAKVAIALVEDVPYILGREDIFDKFRITFLQSSLKIDIEPI